MNRFLYLVLFIFLSSFCVALSVEDDFALELDKNISPAETYLNYNYESTTKIPLLLKVTEPIKSEKEVYEGQKVYFRVVKDVLYNNKLIFKRGEKIESKITAIITPGMNGIPASIIFTNFKLVEQSIKGQLSAEYEIQGQDRSLIVFPLKWALTILPPSGSLTNLIMGGHAKLKTKERITIYYYPEWN